MKLNRDINKKEKGENKMEFSEAIRNEVERKIALGEWSQDDFKNFLADFNVEKIEDLDWRIKEVRERLREKYNLFIDELHFFDEREFKGKKYYLQQMAYFAEDCGTYYVYKATAEDDERNIYEVEWESFPVNEIEGLDEDSYCDWKNPVRITLLEKWKDSDEDGK